MNHPTSLSILQVPSRISLFIVAVGLLLAGCGSAEKYQKSETAPSSGVLQGEMAIEIPGELQEWAQDLTRQMDAADLACSLEDTARGLHLADSLLRVTEAIVDTLDLRSPMQKFLLFYIADGYGRIMRWDSDPESRAALTERHEKLAVRLQARHDSLKAAQ